MHGACAQFSDIEESQSKVRYQRYDDEDTPILFPTKIIYSSDPIKTRYTFQFYRILFKIAVRVRSFAYPTVC